MTSQSLPSFFQPVSVRSFRQVLILASVLWLILAASALQSEDLPFIVAFGMPIYRLMGWLPLVLVGYGFLYQKFNSFLPSSVVPKLYFQITTVAISLLVVLMGVGMHPIGFGIRHPETLGLGIQLTFAVLLAAQLLIPFQLVGYLFRKARR